MKLVPPVPLFPLKSSAGASGALVLVALLGLALYASAKGKAQDSKSRTP